MASGRRAGRLARRWLGPAALVLVLAACARDDAQRCSVAHVTTDAEAALAHAAERLDFEPRLPCVTEGRMAVTAVFLDSLPGESPVPRLNLMVGRGGEQAFVLSQSRAQLQFSPIPQGTHRVRVVAGGATAEGFAGPSGTGVDTAYLRWRVDGITYELAATLRPWLTEHDVLQIVSGGMRR